MKKIAILTSSRSDFGIIMPLLFKLKSNKNFKLSIIVFGTHLSPYHGKTVEYIKKQGFSVNYEIESLLLTDSNVSVASSIGLTILKFAEFWEIHHKNFDLVFCPGDRYEMFAAVSAGIPFNIKFAHIHAGELTLGAIDNIFRHAISHASTFHFTSTSQYAERVKSMIDMPNKVFNVGAMSLDNIKHVKRYSINEFKKLWNIDLSIPTILVTFHPETVESSLDLNKNFANQIANALLTQKQYQIVITMPNADAAGTIIRDVFEHKLNGKKNIILVENFGTRGYFTIMEKCEFLIGNTSSGIIEAASFGKYVIDLGNRQKGRVINKNVLKVAINSSSITSAIEKVKKFPKYSEKNIYWNGGSAEKIIKIIEKHI
jgi:GDP/UDP-N,N'-diacetylbacillosamine 2-epimerase (hydrolysing)